MRILLIGDYLFAQLLTEMFSFYVLCYKMRKVKRANSVRSENKAIIKIGF